MSTFTHALGSSDDFVRYLYLGGLNPLSNTRGDSDHPALTFPAAYLIFTHPMIWRGGITKYVCAAFLIEPTMAEFPLLDTPLPSLTFQRSIFPKSIPAALLAITTKSWHRKQFEDMKRSDRRQKSGRRVK